MINYYYYNDSTMSTEFGGTGSINSKNNNMYGVVTVPVSRILFAILPFFLIIFTIIGNGFVIAAICFNARLNRKCTSVLILNLAFADFLIGAIIMPLALLQILTDGVWLLDRLMCRIWTSLDVICCTASIVTLCIISLDRFIGVTKPLRYNSLVTRRRLCFGVFLVWIYSLTVLLSTLRWRNPPVVDPRLCVVDNELEYVVYSVVLSFFIPLCIVVIIYRKIYVITQRRGEVSITSPVTTTNDSANGLSPKRTSATTTTTPIKNFKSTGENRTLKSARDVNVAIFVPLRIHYGGGGTESELNRQKRFFQMHMKTAKTLGLVVGAFIVCWLPFFILYSINNIVENCVPGFVIEIFAWLGYSNSALNPIIYAVSMRSFGNAFRDIFYRQIYYPIRTCCNHNAQHSPLYGFDSRKSSEANTTIVTSISSRRGSLDVSELRRVNNNNKNRLNSVDYRTVLLKSNAGRSFSLSTPEDRFHSRYRSRYDSSSYGTNM